MSPKLERRGAVLATKGEGGSFDVREPKKKREGESIVLGLILKSPPPPRHFPLTISNPSFQGSKALRTQLVLCLSEALERLGGGMRLNGRQEEGRGEGLMEKGGRERGRKRREK